MATELMTGRDRSRSADAARALGLSLLALLVPVAGAIWFPQRLASYEALLWLLALVPAFLLAYQRGWQGAATALALGMAILSVTYAGTQAVGKEIPQMLFPVLVAYIAITLGLGWFGDEIERRRKTQLFDDRTRLATWAYAQRYLQGEFEAARRGRPIAVVLFEMGTRGGRGRLSIEHAMDGFADVLRENTRRMDMSARLDDPDHRFISLITSGDLKGASIFAHRVLNTFREAYDPGEVTASGGIAVYRPRMRTVQELLDAAEEALTEAKEAGGDRVRALGMVVREPGEAEIQPGESEIPVALETTAESRVSRALVVGPLDPVAAELERRDIETQRFPEMGDALHALQRAYDIVAVDLDHTGPADELIRAVRNRDDVTQILVVVNPRSAEIGLHAMNVGASQALARPLDRRAVRDTVTELLDRRDYALQQSLHWTQVASELTARQRDAMRALAESEERHGAVVERMREVVFQIDADGRWKFLNPAWERLSGLPIPDSLGTSFAAVFHDDDRPSLERRFADLVARRTERLDAQARMVGGVDGTRWVAVTGAPSFQPDGTLNGVYGTLVDVTERRQLEEQLRQAQKMEAIGQLAGGIAHDFNNLLMAIRGHAEYVLDAGILEPELADDLQTVVRETERATGLTRQLLAFSRAHVPDLEILDLVGIVRSMDPMLRRLLGEDIEVEIDAPAVPLRVEADEAQIQQVLLNLAGNARDAMAHGGRFVLRVDEMEVSPEQAESWGGTVAPGPFVRLTVRDTGIGMDSTTAARVFDPFFTTKAVGKGTGLGLSTVFGIVSERQGHIAVHSQPGAGAEFQVYLPRASGPVRDAADRTGRPPHRSSGGRTVLVVEDEQAVRVVIRRYLEAAGFDVHEAESGDGALELATAVGLATFDLVISDVIMPGMGGVELVERLRERRADLPVVFMSGYAREEMNERGHQLRGSFLTKPFDRDDLLTVVASAIHED